MKFTLSWLKDHLDTTAGVEELATKLSAIGLEVESVDDPSAKLGAFRIARVLDAKQHPNADRLRVAQVEIEKGKPPVEVVCGAPNCRTGLVGVFAPLGTYIPGTGITLEKKPVRGIVSNGMLCSERELELSEDHQGIIDLPDDLGQRVGERYVDVMGLADPVFEVKLTPNRPDCTGVRGIARDLAAAGLGTLMPERKVAGVEGKYDCPIEIRLDLPAEAKDACTAFAGRYVKGVKNVPSPAWMQQRLKAVGLRPISALVDITNYISMDRGRPLHVYDADKIEGAIRARLGQPGETFVGLDGKTYEADGEMCMIADDRHALGFGGIMGGAYSGCTEETKNVLIESAYFDPLRTAATGRKAQLQTDARYRFERGVDPAFVVPGLDLATALVLELTGGEPSRKQVAGTPPVEARKIAFDTQRVRKLGGIDVADAEVVRILEALGCTVAGKAPKVEVTAPTWRPDIHGPADLVEEVIRIVGLDEIPSVALPRLTGVARAVLTETQRRARRARRLLAARGLVEAVTWSFIPRKEAEVFGGGQDALELENPISTEMSSMRPGLLPGLITAVQRNRNRGFADVGLFEIGQAYRGIRPADQYLAAAGVRAGAVRVSGSGRHWSSEIEDADLFEVKGDVMATLAALGFDAAKAQVTRDAPAWYHPGRSGTLRLGPKTVLAHFGESHPATLAALDVEGPVVAFEVFLDAVPPEKRKGRARPALVASDLLPVRRDFAFVLGRDVPAGDVVKAALGADKGLVADVRVFDVFEGGSLAADGKKSLAVEVTLQPATETMTDEQIDAVSQKIVAAVTSATGGEIRG